MARSARLASRVDQIPRDPAIPQKVCGIESRGICDAGFAGLDFGQKGQKKRTLTKYVSIFYEKK